ncbi:MAG: hypothetical protein EOS40_08890 [Mesorhizobium sp.]|nr:MAG: hypothetical protein EOS40_08890 [Mesorhizobium sp.]TIT84970.1 MAG: hypothetical protein E5W55_33370 [Mesorhizobium sp.]
MHRDRRRREIGKYLDKPTGLEIVDAPAGEVEPGVAAEAAAALGRAGVADDIGPMIASLLSEDNRWVNAQRIEVSGGMNI